MDKLKKNAFAVSLSGIVLAALVLLYFLVIGRIQAELGADGVKGQVDKSDKTYKKLLKENPFNHGKPWFDTNQAAAGKLKEAAGAGKEFYEESQKKFNEQHPNDTSGDDPANFRSFYESNVEKLQDEYRKVFLNAAGEPKDATAAAVPAVAIEGAQPADPTPVSATEAPAPTPVPAVAPAAQPAAPRPGADGVDTKIPDVELLKNISTVEEIQRARKEFWILTEVFRVANEQKLGGLQRIQFPNRAPVGAAAKAAAAAGTGAGAGREYRWINSRVVIELPVRKLEPFLTALFQSKQVSFRLDSLTMTRPSDTMVIQNVVSKTYETKDEAEKDPLDAIRPEPPVIVQLDLAALDYLGPAATPAAPPEGK